MSVDFGDWNPQKEAFHNREFNSYDRGPGKYLGSTNPQNENSVQLHVCNIPPHITDDGLRALFSKTGTVTNIWKHKDNCYAFITMASLRDAELAIRKLNDFKIEKYKIAVRVAKNDKEKAILMKQKKEDEEFFKKLHSANKDSKEEDWNNDDYPTFSAVGLQTKNSVHNGGDSGFASLKKNPPLDQEIMQSVHNLDTSKNGKTLFDHLEPSKQLESKSRKSVNKANVNASKKQLKPCKRCGKSGTKRCSQCKTPYCSIGCQQQDWSDNHHIECINIYLENASLEDLAERFDVNLNTEASLNSYPDKPFKCEAPNMDGDHRSTSFNKEVQSNKDTKRFNNGKLEKTPPRKKVNSKRASLNGSSSSHSSQNDLSPRKVSPGQEKQKIYNQSRPPKKLDNSSPENVQKPDFKKKQKSPPPFPPSKLSFQKKLSYNKSNVPTDKMKVTKVQLPLHGFCEVLVTNVTSCEDIHVQPIQDVNVLMTTYLITELAKVYEGSGKDFPCISSPVVGEIYACRFSVDSVWYRAQILSINDSDITVKYIDYGNIEVTSCDRMRDLIPDLKEIPQQAVWCTLDVLPSKTCDAINLLIKQEITYDTPYRLKVIRAGDPYIIELYDEDGDVGNKLANLVKSKIDQGHSSSDSYANCDGIQQITSSVNMVADLKNISDHLKTGNKYSIFPFHVISPDDFMVQVVILDKEFHCFNKKLQSCALSCPPVSQKLVPSQLVLVQKPEGQWCRAEVMQIEDASLTVRLLDFGSIETVSIQKVRSVPPFCLDHPIITVPSKLAEIKPVDKQGWSAKLCSIFQETLEAMNASVRVKEQHILGEYIGPDSNRRCLWKLIDLCTNASIADLLVLDGHAILMNPGSQSYEEKSLQHSRIIVSDVPKIPLPIGSVQDGIAIDFQSDIFFINLIQSDLKEFQINFNDFLDSAGYPGTNYIACENEIVAAKFSVDNQWYRGQILTAHDDSMFTVFFIDYGNSELLPSSQLQPLPKHFVSYPKQAIHCKLHNASIPEDGLLQFAKLVLNNICKYKIVSQKNETSNVVVYGSNGECLNDIFKENANGFVSETESLKSNTQTGNSVTGLSTESEMALSSRTSPLPSEGSAAPSLPIQMAPFQPTPLAEGNSSSEHSQHATLLNEQKLSTLSLESRSDSDFVSCVNSPKLKYYSKNMNCLLLEANICYKLHCTSVTSADAFYCQLLDDTAILRYFELMEELAKLCNESSADPAFLPENGQLVAAKYMDNDWYRAKVIDTHEDKVEVLFIDYGNVSLVANGQLREISSEIFVEFPILAVRCCLTGISKLKRMNEISTFQDKTMNVKVVGKVGNSYQLIFEEDLEEQLGNKDIPPSSPSPSPPCKSEDEAEKERIQRQIEELQQKLATLK